MADRAVVRRGVVEALVYFGGAAGMAILAALVWVLLGERQFLDALGLCLLVAGGLVCVGTLNAFSRFGTADAMAALGRGPEGGGESSGQVLTGVGLALLVGAPLLAAGTLVQYLA